MLNFLIQIISKFTKPIQGDPSEWKERSWLNTSWREFHCGSCRGIYKFRESRIEILAIQNTKKGNGDFDKTLAYFFKSCEMHNLELVFLQVGNRRLREKLLRLGFENGKGEMIKRG